LTSRAQAVTIRMTEPRTPQREGTKRMIRAAILMRVVVAIVLISAGAEANVGHSCLVGPLPDAPLTPTFSFDSKGDALGDKAHFEVWRQPCTDGSGLSAVLVRITPLVGNEQVCSDSWTVIQNGTQIDVAMRLSPTGREFCNDVFAPTTVIVVREAGESPFEESRAFTLNYESLTGHSQVSLPPVGPQPPTIGIVAKGCTACKVGFLAGFSARIANSGGNVALTLKGGVRFPDGAVFGLLSDEFVVPAGQETEFDMFSGPVPGDLPQGTYVLEAAILDATFGTLISRNVLVVTLTP
jgi:hypothetical protein